MSLADMFDWLLTCALFVFVAAMAALGTWILVDSFLI
jgi:hypothetical protein